MRSTRLCSCSQSGFPQETDRDYRGIEWYLTCTRTFGGCHSIQLSYGRDALILQEHPHDGVIVVTVAVGAGMVVLESNCLLSRRFFLLQQRQRLIYKLGGMHTQRRCNLEHH